MLILSVLLISLLEPIQSPCHLFSEKPELNKTFQDSLNMRCLGQYPFAEGRTIVSEENAVYLSSGCGIKIFSRINPQSPIASITAPNSIEGLFRHNQYLYFLSHEWPSGSSYYSTDLYIYDVSQPALPSLVCIYPIEGFCRDLYVQGQYVYVTSIALGNLGGLRILNVSNPQAPFQVSYLPLPAARAIDISGNYAYLAHSTGFYVIDVSNPQSPIQVYQWTVPADSLDIDGDRNIRCVGNILYVGGGVIGEEEDRGLLLTFNVSNPSNPQQIGYFEFWGVASCCNDIEIIGNLAYLSYGSILCVNISNPISVFEIGRYVPPYPDWIRQIAVSNDTLYAACCHSLKYVKFSNPQYPMPIFSYSLPGFIWNVAVKENYSYLFTSDGVVILDISNPQSPAECLIYRDSIYTMRTIAGYIVDTLLYLAGSKALNIISISNPEMPSLIGRCILTDMHSNDIKVRGNYAYVAHDWMGFRIYDISNPQSPFLVGQLPTPGQWCYGIALAGNRAYVADGAYFLIVDISNPQAPYIIRSLNTNNYTEKVWARGDTVYVVLYEGLLILNCANPYSISTLSHFLIPNFNGRNIYLEGDRAYLAGGSSSRCYIVDVSNPSSPSILGYYDTPGQNTGIYVHNGLIHTANFQDGYNILEYYDISGVEEKNNANTQKKLELEISPKPTKNSILIEYSVSKQSIVSLDILDTLGRIKKNIKKEQIKPGNYQMNIDVSDLPAGVYFVRLKQGKEQVIERLVIVK
ncbi:MAG: T9SS type A sorting domain-containing protein [candidate division WOR-3 bacterium]